MNKTNTYTYRLKTRKQREALNLLNYGLSIKKIIQCFFRNDFVKVTIKEDRYILVIKKVYSNGEKRRLGKKIATIPELREALQKYIYNDGTGKSTQLFIKVVK